MNGDGLIKLEHLIIPKTKVRWPDKKAGLGVWPAGRSIFLS
jgi:hypothetical protein